MNEMDQLFSKGSLRDVFEATRRKIYEEIHGFDTNYLLNVSINDLIDHIIEKHWGEPPNLDTSKTEICDQGEQKTHHDDYGRSFSITGIYVVFSIPFTGESDLFFYRPSNLRMGPPCAVIKENELRLTYTRGDHNADAIKKSLEKDIANIQKNLNWVRQDVEKWNSALRLFITQEVNARKEKLLKDQGLVVSLGFPIRKKADAPLTYSAPIERKKIAIQKPSVKDEPYIPEPELVLEEYEQILKILSNMILVMERSPRAFATMKEEELRTHFLVQLNGLYEGQATGETFNYEGKTDILIRVDGKNIFIAECKFWDGPKTLQNAIDQLLGYLSWRDTKTAILLFNRRRELSKVLSKIPEVVKAHPNFKKNVDYHNKTGFRFILHSKNDKNRELIVTISGVGEFFHPNTSSLIFQVDLFPLSAMS